jgi:sugar phosphate permease
MSQDIMTTIYSAAPIIGIILAAIIGLIFWKRTSNGPSKERKRELGKKKEEAADKIKENTKKQDEIFVEVKEIEKKRKRA